MFSEHQCEVCRLGKLQLKYTTYTHRYEDHLITVPDVPTWVCDVCDEYAYDVDTILRMAALLDVEARELTNNQFPYTGEQIAYIAGLVAGRRWSIS